MSDQLRPPYVAFQSILELLDALSVEPLASMLFGDQPGSVHDLLPPGIAAALHYLELAGDDGLARPTLRALGHCSDSGRRLVVADLLREHYDWALEVAEDEAASQEKLLAAFTGRGRSGHTARKASTFFQHAARFADIELSPGLRSQQPVVAARKRPIREVGEQTARRRRGHYERTVDLRNGGVVTLGIHGDLLALSPTDTEWVRALIAALDAYEEGDASVRVLTAAAQVS